jgi:hypothetical protein
LELLGTTGGVEEVDFFRGFYQRVQHVGLVASGQLRRQPLPDALAVLGGEDTGGDGRPPGRQFVEYAEVQVSVQGHGQRPRNGRCSHHQHVWIGAFPSQRLPLKDTEAVLLVDERQAEAVKGRALLNERLCPHRNRRSSGSDVGPGTPAVRSRTSPRHQGYLRP